MASPAERPWFSARRTAAGLVVSGAREATLGYRLPRADHERDGGDWVTWTWDGTRLVVENDRLGAYPLYYAASDDAIHVATAIDHLLALGVSTDLDLDGLSVFLAVGYYVGADTAFSAVRALPPAARLEWHPGTLSLDSRPPGFPTAALTRAQAVDGVIEGLRTAVGRCLPDDDKPFGMPISGGRDSRHILLELVRAGRPPAIGLTVEQYPTDWGGDAPFGAGLCQAVEVPHRILRPGPLVGAEWRKNRLCNYAADEHAWCLPVVDAIGSAGGYTFDGYGGGLLLHREFMTGAVRRAWREQRWDELAAGLGKKDEAGRARFTSLLSPAMRTQLTAERAAARIRAELERYRGADDPFLSFTIYNRSVREVALTANAMLAAVVTAYTPFTDPDLFAFGASIPDAMAGTDLHDEIIARAFPEAASIPYVPKRRPRPDRGFLRRTAQDLLSLLERRSDGSLLDRRALQRRALRSAVTGDDWPAWGRRAALITYLAQLETVRRTPSRTVAP